MIIKIICLKLIEEKVRRAKEYININVANPKNKSYNYFKK